MTTIPILLYHCVSATPASWIAPYTVEPQNFARHVALIADSGRTSLTISALAAALRGQRPLPARPVVLTFDDGFADFIYAASILGDHGLASTLFVTTGALEGRPGPARLRIPPARMLQWSQLTELSGPSIEIGAHTHTHPQLDALRGREANDEIRKCKALLEDHLGVAVPAFAYPHGFHSARVRRLVEAAGHLSACAVMNSFSSTSDDLFALARLTIRSGTSDEDLADLLAGRGAPVAPFRERWRTKSWRGYRRLAGGRWQRGVVAPPDSTDTVNSPHL